MPTIESLFVNRRDCYAVQTDNGAWALVNEPLTSDVLVRHLDGKLTAGIYQLNENSEVKWICLDFDNANAEEEAKKLNEYIKTSQYARAALMEHTGGRGFHVWLFFKNRVPAWHAKAVAEALVAAAEVRCEVFPKQTKLDTGSYGNLVRLPLGIHKKTGLRSKLIEPDDLEKIVPAFIEPEEEPAETRAEVRAHDVPPCWTKMFQGVDKGARDWVAFNLARRLRYQGLDRKQCEVQLLDWNQKNRPPLKKSDIEKCVGSAFEGEYRNIGCTQVKSDERLVSFCDEEHCPRGRKKTNDLPDDMAERTRNLWSDVIAAVKRWRHFDDPMNYIMLTLFIFQCYCVEVLPNVFYLFIHGGMGTGKSGIARLLAYLGDGICGAMSTPAAMIRDLKERPRLVTIDEFDSPTDPTMKSLEQALLRAGYQRGVEKRVCDPEDGNSVVGLSLFGPRILVYRTTIDDDALTTRGYEIKTSPYHGGEEGYEYVRVNAFDIDLHLKPLKERLREFGMYVTNPNYWSLQKSYEVTGSTLFKQKMRTVLDKAFSANRQTELAMSALLVAEIIGVDVAEELKSATSASVPLGDDDLAEVELFRASLDELAFSTAVKMDDTVKLVKQSDIKARIDARRMEQRRRRTNPQVFALIRERAGIDEATGTVHVNNAVYIKWPNTPSQRALSEKKQTRIDTPLPTLPNLPAPDWSSSDSSGRCSPALLPENNLSPSFEDRVAGALEDFKSGHTIEDIELRRGVEVMRHCRVRGLIPNIGGRGEANGHA